MSMMKTCPFVPFPDAFNAEKALEGSKIASQNLDLYERPTDKLGSHLITFEITQKQFIVGNVKRTLNLDFYRKRMTIKGNFEGTVFECRGNMIKSYEVDEKDHFLVRITFSTTSSPQEFWMESTDDIQKLFESMTEFRECCNRRNATSSKN